MNRANIGNWLFSNTASNNIAAHSINSNLPNILLLGAASSSVSNYYLQNDPLFNHDSTGEISIQNTKSRGKKVEREAYARKATLTGRAVDYLQNVYNPLISANPAARNSILFINSQDSKTYSMDIQRNDPTPFITPAYDEENIPFITPKTDIEFKIEDFNDWMTNPLIPQAEKDRLFQQFKNDSLLAGNNSDGYNKTKNANKQAVNKPISSSGAPFKHDDDNDNKYKDYEHFKKKDGSGRYECNKAESPQW